MRIPVSSISASTTSSGISTRVEQRREPRCFQLREKKLVQAQRQVRVLPRIVGDLLDGDVLRGSGPCRQAPRTAGSGSRGAAPPSCPGRTPPRRCPASTRPPWCRRRRWPGSHPSGASPCSRTWRSGRPGATSGLPEARRCGGARHLPECTRCPWRARAHSRPSLPPRTGRSQGGWRASRRCRRFQRQRRTPRPARARSIHGSNSETLGDGGVGPRRSALKHDHGGALPGAGWALARAGLAAGAGSSAARGAGATACQAAAAAFAESLRRSATMLFIPWRSKSGMAACTFQPAGGNCSRLRKTRHVAAERNQLTGKQGRVLALRQLSSKRLGGYLIQASRRSDRGSRNRARSFSAVFSPIPATPGTLSEESPVRARKSTICSG